MAHTPVTQPRGAPGPTGSCTLDPEGFPHRQSHLVPGFLERQRGSKLPTEGLLWACHSLLPAPVLGASPEPCYLHFRANGKYFLPESKGRAQCEREIFAHALTWAIHKAPRGRLLLYILPRAGSSRLASSADPPAR